MARSSVRRYTAASSLVSKPTITFGSDWGGRRLSTASRMLGLSFAAQPAAFAVVVNRTASANSALRNANSIIAPSRATFGMELGWDDLRLYVLGELGGTRDNREVRLARQQ